MSTLRLIPAAPDSTTTADAWFLPGGHPARWLAALAAWPSGSADTRLALIPTTGNDLRPCGVLVLSAHPPAAQLAAIPFVRRGATLYLPQAAQLWPPVADDELPALLPGELVVWHPGCGPVAFARSELRRASDLLAAPPLARDAWTAAHPGERAPRLAVIVVPLPDVDQLLAGGQGDIASHNPTELSPLPGEPPAKPSLLGKLRFAVGKALADGIDRLPHTASQPTWANQLQDWARKLQAHNDPRLAAVRERELQRLLQALADDPDAGLRYALPLAGGGAHRGMATPGSHLSRHDLARSADGAGWLRDGMGGGRPLDPWQIDARTRQLLQARYRELAARETALGQHRRAAYIHGALLGDLHAAAGALEQGKLFREAAALHLDQLKQPLAAAQCLERGGLLAEAAELYRKHGHHLPAADCFARLERLDEARTSWRAAVAERQAAHDLLGAAELLTDRLAASDEALALLAGTWPRHVQAGKCLLARCDLLARLGRHAEVAELVEGFASQDDGQPELAFAAQDHVARRAPEPAARALAADAGRRLVARHLAAAGVGGVGERLLGQLHRLAPHDPLLAQDATRWRRQAQESGAKPRPLPSAGLRPLLQFRLKHADWRLVVAHPLGLIAAGWRDKQLVVSRVTWAGENDTQTQELASPGDLTGFLLSDRRLYLRIQAQDGWAPLPIKTLPATDRWNEPLQVGTIGPLHGTVAACAADHDGGWRMMIATDTGFDLIHVARSGPSLINSCPEERPAMQPHLGRLGTDALYELDRKVHWMRSDRKAVGFETSDYCEQFVPHPDPQVCCTLVFTFDGLLIVWGSDEKIISRGIPSSMPTPVFGFTADGIVVVAPRQGGSAKAYRCTPGHVVHLADSPGPIGPLLALVTGPGTGSVIFVLEGGKGAVEWRIT